MSGIMRRLVLIALVFAPVAAMAQTALLVPQTGRSSTGAPVVTRQDLAGSLATKADVSVVLRSTAPADKSIFIGGTYGLSLLANPATANPLIATGKIGLYEHAVGMAGLTSLQLTQLLAAWAPTGVSPGGGGQGVAEISIANAAAAAPGGNNSVLLFGPNAVYPAEVVMNHATFDAQCHEVYTAAAGEAHPGQTYPVFCGATDVAIGLNSIGLAFANGVKNVAYNVSPNSGTEDLDDPFATSGYWANVRALYLAGGGGALDVPPTYFSNRTSVYQNFIIQELQWMRANNLRSSLILSPLPAVVPQGYQPNSAFDPQFMENTRKLYALLRTNNALPSQWVVENYAGAPPFSSNVADGSAEGLDTVALFLAQAGASAPAGPATPTTAGGLPDAGLEAGPAYWSARVALSAVHPGALTLSDLPGLGTMALQDQNNVVIGGGTAQLTSLNVLNDEIVGGYALFGGVSSRSVSGQFPNLGLGVAYNLSGYLGENDLLMGPGAGPGGLSVYPLNSAGFIPGQTPVFTINATGNVTVSGTLTTGSRTLTPSLGVTGDAAVNGNTTTTTLGVSGNAAVNGILTAVGGTTTTSLGVTGNAAVNGDTETGSLGVGGNAGVNGKLTAGRLNVVLSTPASSTAACTTGDMTADASYQYVCVTTNSWKRAALSAF